MTEFRIISDDFAAGGYFSHDQELDNPAFGANGKNRSPALRWEGVPNDAKSLAISVYDPDAPTGSGFWHWVVVNLPITTRMLPADAGRAAGDLLPSGSVQLANDYGLPGFGGFAPPKGDKPHRYIFRVHALKVASLPVEANMTNAVARFMLHLNEIDSATVTGLYEIS
ncbi:MAG: YbhB/YbcL family Raf kinase inhibitor-like protein [Janthinobacterium lividum]